LNQSFLGIQVGQVDLLDLQLLGNQWHQEDQYRLVGHENLVYQEDQQGQENQWNQFCQQLQEVQMDQVDLWDLGIQ
jgi:hypothetical protein